MSREAGKSKSILQLARKGKNKHQVYVHKLQVEITVFTHKNFQTLAKQGRLKVRVKSSVRYKHVKANSIILLMHDCKWLMQVAMNASSIYTVELWQLQFLLMNILEEHT